jgi:hypothetical protein
MQGLADKQDEFVPHYWGVEIMKVFKWHSELAERLRLKLGWSHYVIYWVSFIKGVAVTCLVFWLS